MTASVGFHALAFDLVDGRLDDGPLIDCGSPQIAIQTAQGQWKIFGHAGAVAFSRISHLDGGNRVQRHVLRRFGQVPDAYLKDDSAE